MQQVQDGGIFALREGAADNQHRDLVVSFIDR